MAVHSATTIGAQPKRKEIYKYEAPWTVYSMNWSVRPDKRFRLALGSFIEEYNNKVSTYFLGLDSVEFLYLPVRSFNTCVQKFFTRISKYFLIIRRK